MENDKVKALTEVAKFGTKALEVTEKGGQFLSRVLGPVPADLVGVLGGDWVRHARIRNLDRLAGRTEEILRERKVKQLSL